MIKKTLGGDRLGSGNKMKVALHNYERSTHDLGNAWRSTMAPGVLVPFYKKISTNGDTWTMDLKQLVRTMPAIGPLLGSYKLQLDMFEVPIRLYNGILHNNMTKIGMDMAKVKLPKMELGHKWINRAFTDVSEKEKKQVSSSSLVCYTGLRGIGSALMSGDYLEVPLRRKFQCVPILAYYDIFKNYYANKQEENAFVIDCDIEQRATECESIIVKSYSENLVRPEFTNEGTTTGPDSQPWWETSLILPQGDPAAFEVGTEWTEYNHKYNLLELYRGYIKIKWDGPIKKDAMYLKFIDTLQSTEVAISYYDMPQYYDAIGDKLFTMEFNEEESTTTIILNKTNINQYLQDQGNTTPQGQICFAGFYYVARAITKDTIKLKPFPLSNIDDMRIWLLQNTTLGTEITINDFDKQPYKANYEIKADGNSGCRNTMNGLVVKTYQSDIFNNWLSSEWIDSIKGINAISAVAVEEGKFTIDALNLAHKVYNMLNRIAISGGTYEDWQEAVYGEDALRRAESPIYCGGASGIIAFEEVVSTADTETASAGDQPLGSLAGKGTLTGVQGGEIEIHVKEPSYVMGIVSITPYIDYCQGNDFDITELDSLNDLHKPELDEIGFQDLLLERAAYWNTYYDITDDTPQWKKLAGGKLPAWIEYMTSVNQVYGEFAEKDKLGFMVLTRDYEEGYAAENESHMPGDEERTPKYSMIKDWTTYINPTKFNYQFADTSLSAQNFWVQIKINAIARRKMSAKLIPNL